MHNKMNYIDVTNDWISKANPNSHEIKELNYWDLKEIKTGTKRVIDSRLNGQQKNQSSNYIIDISGNPLPNIAIVNQIKKIFTTKSRQWLNTIILIKNGKIIIILKRG